MAGNPSNNVNHLPITVGHLRKMTGIGPCRQPTGYSCTTNRIRTLLLLASVFQENQIPKKKKPHQFSFSGHTASILNYYVKVI